MLCLDPRAAELAGGRKKCGLAAGKNAASRHAAGPEKICG